MMIRPGFQERCARWSLLLTMLHTVPAVWITPVAGGTAPTIALLAFGVASLLTPDRATLFLGLIVLIPALIYSAIAWGLAWLAAMTLQRLQQPVRHWLLAISIVALLASTYFPIFIAGGHNSSRSARLFELFDNTFSSTALTSYWIVLHVVLALLFTGHLLRNDHPVITFATRWHKPVLATTVITLISAFLFHSYSVLICRPLAELGSTHAQVCVAKSTSRDQRYWYERAASDGNVEAIAWLIEHTANRRQRLIWLRKGAELGDAAIQFALYRELMRLGGPTAAVEARRWLDQAVEGDYGPAQYVLVETLSREIYRTQSRALLAEHNTWLEQAAENGSRMAKLRLAQYYSSGSMGYSADLAKSRFYYEALANTNELSDSERALQIDTAVYQQRLEELDAWELGLKNHDPTVVKALAKRYLRSQLPGPGVRKLGISLMEQVAEKDYTARDELIVLLRTGANGVAKNLDAAKSWLIKAAQSGDPAAMDRLTNNYMSGREGFAVDYPKARHWINVFVEKYQGIDTDGARARVRDLQNKLRYIDRLEEQAGGALLGDAELIRLGQRNDAESHYRYARQLLAGHGTDSRREAIARLQEAAALGHGAASWRLFQIYEKGFASEIDPDAALYYLHLAVDEHHFDAARELAMRYEYGKRGLKQDLQRAIELYESTLAAGRDNRHDWNLDPNNYNHFKWLESRLRQARLKLQTRPVVE
jgi:TPR repeat protein